MDKYSRKSEKIRRRKPSICCNVNPKHEAELSNLKQQLLLLRRLYLVQVVHTAIVSFIQVSELCDIVINFAFPDYAQLSSSFAFRNDVV